jgi:hypothetical protein
VTASTPERVDEVLAALPGLVSAEPLSATGDVVRRRVVLSGPDTRPLSEHLLDARLAVCELEVQAHG